MGIVRGMSNSALRWVLVLCGALIGSYGGRIGAAALRGEPIEPLLRFDKSALMRPDVVPGFLAVEFVGKVLKLSPLSAGLIAAAAAAAAAFAEGPIVKDDSDPLVMDSGAGDFGPVV